MCAQLTIKDIDLVKNFGTAIKCGTERYVLELKKLDEAIHFINPKDAGTKYGDQNLKGDGNDILLLNGVTAKQIEIMDTYLKGFETPKEEAIAKIEKLLATNDEEKKAKLAQVFLNGFRSGKGDGKKAEEMNAEEVKALLGFLEENGFNDRYCSNQDYKARALIPTNGRMCRRNNDECRGVVIPVGTIFTDGEKTQEATTPGALFVIDAKGGARITNVPEDYQTINIGEKVCSFADAIKKRKAFLEGRDPRI